MLNSFALLKGTALAVPESRHVTRTFFILEIGENIRRGLCERVSGIFSGHQDEKVEHEIKNDRSHGIPDHQ